MDTKKILTPAEHLAERSWTKFLESLPFGDNQPWRIENYRDFISLRSTASILTNRKGATRFYYLRESNEDNTIYLVTVSDIKKDTTSSRTKDYDRIGKD